MSDWNFQVLQTAAEIGESTYDEVLQLLTDTEFDEDIAKKLAANVRDSVLNQLDAR